MQKTPGPRSPHLHRAAGKMDEFLVISSPGLGAGPRWVQSEGREALCSSSAGPQAFQLLLSQAGDLAAAAAAGG